MRKLFFLSFLFLSVNSYSYELNIKDEIPERYTLFSITIPSSEKIDEKQIKKDLDNQCKTLNVEQCKLVIYDEHKLIAGIADRFKNKKIKNEPLLLVPIEARALFSPYFEKLSCFEISPQELYKMYDDNEVIADEDLKGRHIILELKVNSVAKNALGFPYIVSDLGRNSFKSIHLFLDKKDPFLRKIKKGSKIWVYAASEGFVFNTVKLKGEIVEAFTDNKKIEYINGKFFEEKIK